MRATFIIGEPTMHPRLGLGVVALALLLAGCGSTTGDRAVSGAGIGAAAGAITGAFVGAPLTGAAIGAAAGGAIGAATNPSQVDLGKPVWQ
jgi:osmotically inducible lipoprotein OsmB